jgi:hypothetical protein
MSNAERQKKFREERRKKGLIRRDGWTNREGLLAPPTDTGAWATMTQKELEKSLKKLASNYDETEKEIFFAEVFEYAKRIEKRFTPLFEKQREIIAKETR